MLRVVEARTLSASSMSKIMQFVKHDFNLTPEQLQKYVPFTIEGYAVGMCSSEFVKVLVGNHPSVFTSDIKTKSLRFVPSVEAASFEDKTKALGEVNVALRDQGLIKGWRDELLPVSATFNSDPYMKIERAACSYFGVKAYGVHVNGFVRDPVTKRVTHLWVATRSPTKPTWPGMLDHIVAGGIPFGINLMENVIKECKEEANIDEGLASFAVPVGAVSYASLDEVGNLRRDCLFCYDLELPETFTPTPADGEVEKFELMEIGDVLDKVVEGCGSGGKEGYKPNCNLVLLDFFIRHGIISPESSQYLELLTGLRSGDCS